MTAIPRSVVIPMLQGFGVPVKPLVGPGDTVTAGQMVGRDDTVVSTPVHATISGKVSAVKDIEFAGRKLSVVAIEGDGTDSSVRIEGASADWERLSASQIEELLYLSGATGLAREGIPTRFHSAVIGPDAVSHVIVSQVGADIFSPNVEALLTGENLPAFATGVSILGRVMPSARFHVALSDEKRGLLSQLSKLLAADPRAEVHGLEPRYPQEFSEMLFRSVLKQDFPFGFSAANVGVVVMDVTAVLAARAAVVEGRPVIERVVALSGPGFEHPEHVRIRIGTPLERVLAGRLKPGGLPLKIVLDSVLSGPAVDDLSRPIDRTTTQVIAIPDDSRRLPFAFARPGLHNESFSRSFVPAWLPVKKVANTNRHGEERPCIQCGWCARACPVRIMPHLIYRQARVAVDETLVRYNVFNCIDCNLCTLVCPSKIPLAGKMRDAKAKLLEVGCDNSSCVVPRFDLKGIEDYKGVKNIR